jgi:hypothetical protein
MKNEKRMHAITVISARPRTMRELIATVPGTVLYPIETTTAIKNNKTKINKT